MAYVPLYSSAKDPVNMLEYVASHVVDDDMKVVHYDKIDELVNNGVLLVNVRYPPERDNGFIPNSINIPLGQLRDRMGELPKDQTIYASCQVGLRGYLACEQNGFDVVNVSRGYKTSQLCMENK